MPPGPRAPPNREGWMDDGPSYHQCFDPDDHWVQMNKSLRYLIDRLAAADGELPTVSLTLVSPTFDDSPIIATLADFEEVTGRSGREIIGGNCRFLNAGCENDPETLAFMRKISSSPEAADKFRQQYPKGKDFVLQNVRTARTKSTMSETENMIYFYNFIHIFGVEANLHNTRYPLLVGIQYVLTKPSDFVEAGSKTRAVQSVLEDSRDLGLAFRRWTSTALERFIAEHGSDNSAASTVEGAGIFATRPELLPTLPDDEPRQPVSSADLASRARILIATLDHVERLVGTEMMNQEGALANDRLAQKQFDELVELRKETYQLFHADIEQFISWYTVPTAWKESQC